jgi:hypothetical protein
MNSGIENPEHATLFFRPMRGYAARLASVGQGKHYELVQLPSMIA